MNRFERKTNRYAGVRTPTKKYVKYEGGFEELFDLAADPHELNMRRRTRPMRPICRRCGPCTISSSPARRRLLGALSSATGICRIPQNPRNMAALKDNEHQEVVGLSDALAMFALKKTAAGVAIRSRTRPKRKG